MTAIDDAPAPGDAAAPVSVAGQELTTHTTFCRVCHAACPIQVDVVANRAVAVRGVPDDPLFGGYTCTKGRQIPDHLAHPGRLQAPLVRRADGTFGQTTSAAALDHIAGRLRAIVDEHGPRAVAVYTGTGGYQSSVAVPTGRAFLKGIGSSSFYTSLTIDQPAKATAPSRSGSWEAGFHGFAGADVLMAIGYNPLVSSYGPTGGLQGTNPLATLRAAQRDGLRLVVVDPRRTELAAYADVHLAIRPGEDPVLLAGMIRLILAEGLHDAGFCDQWVGDLDQLHAAVEPFTLDVVAQRCDVPADDIVAAARLFAGANRGTAGTGTGPGMGPHSSLTEHLAITLNVLCGRVNREGDALGAGAFLLPEMPARAQAVAPRSPANGPHARIRGLRGYYGEMPTATLAEEILTPGEGRIRALIVMGGNPVVAWPDQALTLEALRDLELLVVVDHRMSATAELADVVLAPTHSLERADVPHLMDTWFSAPYTNYTEAVLQREGDVLTEWEVYWELARRLGTPVTVAGGALPMDERPTDDEVIDLVYAKARMPVDEMRAHRRTVHPDRARRAAAADPACTARFTLAPADLMDDLAGALASGGTDGDDGYPYRLVSRRLKHVLNSFGSELPVSAAKGTTNPAYLNPLDAAELGVADGDLLEISSRHGTILGVAETAGDLRRGVVSMAHAWGGTSLTDDKVRDIGSPTNRLVSTSDGYDRVTGMAVQSAIPVRVVRVDTL